MATEPLLNIIKIHSLVLLNLPRDRGDLTCVTAGNQKQSGTVKTVVEISVWWKVKLSRSAFKGYPEAPSFTVSQ